MMPIRALIVGFVFVSFLQDSFEVDFTSVRDLKAASDRVSVERRAICESLCRSKRQDTTRFEKERATDVCIRKCVHSKREGLNQGLNFGRSRRNAHKQEDNECFNPQEFVEYPGREPSSIKVDFSAHKPNLLISWSPVHYNRNWTLYAVHFTSAGKSENVDNLHCKLVPKDQHEWILQNGSGWNYPDGIWVGIITYPYSKYEDIKMKSFATTPRPPPTFPPTSSDVPTKLIAAISGAASGCLLLVFAFLVYRKQINLPWPFRPRSPGGNEPGHAQMNPRIFNPSGAFTALPTTDLLGEDGVPCPSIDLFPNISVLPEPKKPSGPETYYACYYPESPSYQFQVARVVNYFRKHGYTVEMDVMNSNERLDLGPTRWSEQQIRKALNVFVFLSPGLVRLCGSDDKGVDSSHQEYEHCWIELDLLRREYTQTHSLRKMVCIILPNIRVDERDLPSWAQITYKWPEDVENIFKRLNGRPIIQPSSHL